MVVAFTAFIVAVATAVAVAILARQVVGTSWCVDQRPENTDLS
jgi:hypothetical protein